MKRRRALLKTLAITAGLVALVLGLRACYPRFLARHWQKRLKTVPDDRAPVLLDAIAQLGEPGLPVLVEALGSERESVAGGARRALMEEMRRWETLRARDYSPKLATLAKSLADRVVQFGPTAQADAAELAARMLKWWRLDDNVVDPAEVIASCEKVLRVTGLRRPALASQGRPDETRYAEAGVGPPAIDSADSRSGPRSPANRLPEPVPPLQDAARLPGGGLPIEMHEAFRGTPGGSGGTLRAGADRGGPRGLAESGRSPEPLRQPRRLLIEPGAVAAIPERGFSSGGGESSGPTPLRRLRRFGEGGSPADDSASGPSDGGRLAAVATVELMRRLQAQDAQTVVEAKTELARRGFRPVHLELARQMFDPDPEVRMELARRLPELAGIDAAPWLLELSRDENAEVRLSAMALMATTGDPALLKAIEAFGREDPDPRVQLQAQRIARRKANVTY